MYLELTADEQDLISGTRRHLAATAGPQLLRELEGRDVVTDRAWWRVGAELGWAAPLVPEELGGGSVTGTPARELGLVAHERGALTAPGPLAEVSAAVVGLVDAAAARPDLADLLEAVVGGETIVVWAAGVAGAYWEPFGAELTNRASGDSFVIDGVGPLVEVGSLPDVLLVSATLNGVPVQLLVPADAPGLHFDAQVSIDLARRYARLRFEGVELESSALLSSGEEAQAQVEKQFQIASGLLAADTLGALGAGFDLTMEWMRDRFSFGRPIASYQALKHRMADIRTHLEVARAITVAALDAIDAGSDEAAELASMAQAYVGEHAPFIFSEFIQFHGGIGVTWEHDLHVFLRRAMLNGSAYGTAADHQRRLATTVLKGA